MSTTDFHDLLTVQRRSTSDY